MSVNRVANRSTNKAANRPASRTVNNATEKSVNPVSELLDIAARPPLNKSANVREEVAERNLEDFKEDGAEDAVFKLQTTDLVSLFSAPVDSSRQVIATNLLPTAPKSLQGRFVIERFAGSYRRYQPNHISNIYGETLKKLGPTGFATFMLSKAPSVNLKRRKRALKIVGKLATPNQSVPRRVTAL